MRLILCGVAAGLALLAVSFAWPLQFLLPFALAALGLVTHPGVPVGALVLGSLLSFSILGEQSAIALLAWSPGGILMPFLVRKKASSLSVVAAASSVICIALWLFMMYYSDANAVIDGLGESFAQQAREFAALQQMDEASVKTLISFWSDQFDYVKISMPGMIINISMLYALFMYLMCRAIAKRRSLETAPFPPFERWTLPKGFTFGAVLFLIAAEFLPRMNPGINQALPVALAVMVTLPLSVQGMSVAEFYLKRKKFPTAGRVTVIAAVTLFANTVMMFLGIFEQVLKLRKRADTLPK